MCIAKGIFIYFIFNTHWRIFFSLISRESERERGGGEKERDTSMGCLPHVPLPGLGDLVSRSVPLAGI